MKDRIFQRADWICGAIATLVSFVVYAWTTAPSVTLLDSGEFIVAAQHFGVPHPTGYPVWTMLAWLFQLIPLGNVAWQLALFSGVCGALAVGLATMLIRNSVLWMLPAAGATVAGVCSISMGLVFAFSFSMWSQAVIVEVYTLHALLIGLYLTSLYMWLRRPERLAGLYWSFLLIALAFSNHQLTLVFMIAPLQFFIIALLRRDLFWDLALALAVCALIGYLAFARMSEDAVVLTAALRLAWLVLTIFVITLVVKRGRLKWSLIIFLPFVLAIGLLPYAYMPLASATNPPMNWSYTKAPDGFFYSFNRSQYPGTLSGLSLRVFSKVLGVAGGAQDQNQDSAGAIFDELRDWSGFFWMQLVRSFSPACVVFFLAAVLGVFRRPLAARTWIYLLTVAFLLAMGLQPVLEHARTDNTAWWGQMPYHTYTNFIFAVICGIGACFVWTWLAERRGIWRRAAWVLLLLPLWPVTWNGAEVSQRNHWFGWKFGRDMIANLPKGSVIFGGTDPGRFIPTYLILGESTLPPSRKIDPTFDRRDLYIITQNALSDRYYLNYIRDQYTTSRPRVSNAFERWLGRDKAYPDKPLILPSLYQMQQIRQETAAKVRESGEALTGPEVDQASLAGVAKWIFDRNKAEHAFYVEESFVMRWSYNYAIPEGLLYRLTPEPFDKLPEDAVKKDFAFWDQYVPALLHDPAYRSDYDAQRSFSHLRLTGGAIYEYRGLMAEAEKAYRQSLDLWSGSIDAITGLTRILWARGEFDEVIALYKRAAKDDPNSASIREAVTWAEFRKQSQLELDALLPKWRKAPDDMAALEKILTLYSQISEEEKVDEALAEAYGKLGDNPRFLFLAVRVSEAQNKWQQAADAAGRWSKADPLSTEAFYRLARAQFVLGNQKESMRSLGTAMRLGGVVIRERLFTDPVFKPLKEVPELKKLMVAPPPETRPGNPAP
ncbi:MAG: protein O-mannosyl-transferase family [Chthoniobacterales bacterium]